MFRVVCHQTQTVNSLHDMLDAPFFAGAAGTGHVWWWRQAIEQPNLWKHFARFAKMVDGIDPGGESFYQVRTNSSRCVSTHCRVNKRCLSGVAMRNDWRSELVEKWLPRPLQTPQLTWTNTRSL